MGGRAGLVTGSARGIGRASAVALARAGASVVVSDLEDAREEGEETVRLAEEAGGEARFVACDVSADADVAALVAATVVAYGRLDFAHNNAGIPGIGPLLADIAEAEFDRIVAVNLKGVWLAMKHEIGRMAAGSGGAIVNTSSVAGLVGGPSAGAYAATKHAVVGLTKSAALEYADRGIRVNAVCPGAIRSRLTDALPEDALASGLARQAIKRIGEPEEVAAAVVWLLSDDASFVTGSTVPVDAGLLAFR